jgi:hypothetical protein
MNMHEKLTPAQSEKITDYVLSGYLPDAMVDHLTDLVINCFKSKEVAAIAFKSQINPYIETRLGFLVGRALRDHARHLLAVAALDHPNGENAEKLRREWRKEVANELRTARAELKEMRREIQNNQLFTEDQKKLCKQFNYPLPPTETVKFSTGKNLPTVSGIYFGWRGGHVMYVGQSISIQRRCNIFNHGKLYPGDELSWLEFPESELMWAESFYIGVCRPPRNGTSPRRGRNEIAA